MEGKFSYIPLDIISKDLYTSWTNSYNVTIENYKTEEG
jgi:hypothetical protein